MTALVAGNFATTDPGNPTFFTFGQPTPPCGALSPVGMPQVSHTLQQAEEASIAALSPAAPTRPMDPTMECRARACTCFVLRLRSLVGVT